MPNIIDATVVNSAYDTSSNGGRKLVRLDNGWLVAGLWDSSGKVLRFYKTEKGDWSDAVQLCYRNGLTRNHDSVSLVSKGTRVFAIARNTDESSNYYVGFWTFDATTVSNIDIGINTVDNANQTALGNVSLAINEAKTELHATWASKNASLNNCMNLRYAKGTINADGSVTWGAVEQVTTYNSTSYTSVGVNPCILVLNNIPTILMESHFDFSSASSSNVTVPTNMVVIKRDKTLFTTGLSFLHSSWSGKAILVNSYAQSSPSAIFVPQSINGLANGLMANVWHGTDSTSGGVNYIRFSKSTDLGVNWSTMQKLVVGTNATLTANKNGKLFITYEDAGVTKRIESSDNGDTWSSAITLGAGTNPSSLFDLTMNMTEPLTIRKGASSVLFSGTWTVTTISVTPGDIGQIRDKNNILSYSITTDGSMSTITEKINGTVVNTRTATSGQANTLGLTQAQWDEIRFGKYADYSGNLVKPFRNWTLHANSVVNSDYSLTLNATATAQNNSIDIGVSPNRDYYISFTSNGNYFVHLYDSTMTLIQSNLFSGTGNLASTFKTTSNTSFVKIVLGSNSSGTFTFSNPMLIVGTVAQAFSPYIGFTSNTLTVEMGTEKWTYTFDKRLATDADILSAIKATQDSNEVYLPAVKKQLVDAINAKGGSVSANADWLTMIGGLKSSLDKKTNFVSGSITSASSAKNITNYTGSSASINYVDFDMSVLPFIPSRIVFYRDTKSDYYVPIWSYSNIYESGSNYANAVAGSGIVPFRVPYSNGVVSIPVYANTSSYSWIAYE